VSVLDVLPSSVVSVYFFYDPELRHLRLGTLSALVEVWLAQQIRAHERRRPHLAGCVAASAASAGASAAAPAPGGAPPGPGAGAALMRFLDLNMYVHACRPMRYKRGFAPSELRCPQTGRWAPLDRRALARLDEDPAARLAPGPEGPEAEERERERAAAARRLEAQRAQRAAPAVMTQLRDGSAWPFGALTPRSVELAGAALGLFVQRAGRELAARALVDPSGMAAAGWTAEEARKRGEERDEKLAKAREARVERLRDALRAEARSLGLGSGGPGVGEEGQGQKGGVQA